MTENLASYSGLKNGVFSSDLLQPFLYENLLTRFKFKFKFEFDQFESRPKIPPATEKLNKPFFNIY